MDNGARSEANSPVSVAGCSSGSRLLPVTRGPNCERVRASFKCDMPSHVPAEVSDEKMHSMRRYIRLLRNRNDEEVIPLGVQQQTLVSPEP